MNKAIQEIQELTTPLNIDKNWPNLVYSHLNLPIKCYLSPDLLSQNKKIFVDNNKKSKHIETIKENGVYIWLKRLDNGDLRAVYVGISYGRTSNMIKRTRTHFRNTLGKHLDCIVHEINKNNELLCIERDGKRCERTTRDHPCLTLGFESDVVEDYLKKIRVLFFPIPNPGETNQAIHENVIRQIEGVLIAAIINNYCNDKNFKCIMNSKSKAFSYSIDDKCLPKIYQAIEKCWKSEPA